MTFSVVPDKASGDIFTEAMWDTYLRDNLNTGPPVLLANSTLGGTSATIDFTSISSAFTTLFIVGYARGDTAATSVNVNGRFNGDTGSNYDVQALVGVAATASAGEALAQTAFSPVAGIPANTAGANLFGCFTIEIPYYSQASNNKNGISMSGNKIGTATTNLGVAIRSLHWRSNAAINQVTLIPAAGNFVSGSRFTLYGMP